MAAHITGYLHATAAAAPSSSRPPPPLFLCEGRATSAQDASSRVAALAAGLMQVLGMQVGDRVCLAALATDCYLEALLAVTAGGAIAAPLNWRWAAAEAAAAAQLVGAHLLLADAACLRFALSTTAAADSAVQALVLLGPAGDYRQEDLAAAPPGITLAFAESLIDGCPDTSVALRSAPGNAALIVFTSGTTGKPKGVTLSHAALHAQSMAKLLTCGYSSGDVYLHSTPLFHIGGLSSALAMLAAGARHVFLPRFDGAALLGAIQQHGVTSFIAVPTMVADVLAAAGEAGVASLPGVTRILVGGGGMSTEMNRGLAALCPAATVHAAYGMTEGASSLTFATLWGPNGSGNAADASSSNSAAAQPAGSPGGIYVGRTPPGIELAVYRPLGGFGMAASSGSCGGVQLAGEGEVLTRGPHVMLGYWDDDDATAAVQLPGGWLRTGDLGRLYQGRLWLMGRAKDMIKTGGENVHAWEVERALASHPAIAAAAVVGVSDWRLGEAVAAAIVLRPGWCWRDKRCQVLLTAVRRHEAINAALAAATAALVPSSPLAGNGLGLGRSLSDMWDDGEGEQQATGRGIGRAPVEEDLCSTVLHHLRSRPGSGQGMRGLDGSGLLTVVALPEQAARHPAALPDALQQLMGVAAGLERTAVAAVRVHGDSGFQADGDDKAVEGHALQQHCRAAGLAGFKLPRVFLLCDSTTEAPAVPGSGSVLLPVNSTGKVVKHLLRQQVQQHMQAAGKAAATGGGNKRPRARL